VDWVIHPYAKSPGCVTVEFVGLDRRLAAANEILVAGMRSMAPVRTPAVKERNLWLSLRWWRRAIGRSCSRRLRSAHSDPTRS